MGKITLLLHDGDEPVPLDYRDLVVTFHHPRDIDKVIADFATRVTEALQVGMEGQSHYPPTCLNGSISVRRQLKTRCVISPPIIWKLMRTIVPCEGRLDLSSDERDLESRRCFIAFVTAFALHGATLFLISDQRDTNC